MNIKIGIEVWPALASPFTPSYVDGATLGTLAPAMPLGTGTLRRAGQTSVMNQCKAVIVEGQSF